MKCFWNRLKKLQKSDVNSTLHADDPANFYKNVMSDEGIDINNHEHKFIHDFVESKFSHLSSTFVRNEVHHENVASLILKLNRGVSAGADGITTEHLYHGSSAVLCKILADFYSSVLSYAVVPDILQTSVIIPILKKPSLDTSMPSSFRPVSISSVYSKLIELLIFPNADIHDTQFGFREKRGTAFVTSLVNDTAAYFSDRGSPMYISSLDAEKCFDTIWHQGLFYKLWEVLPSNHWFFLLKWYKTSFAVVSWHGCYSFACPRTKGMKQGSILSPALFNIFINDLLIDLENCSEGVRVFGQKFNSCAYADDISVFSSTVTGLQNLVNMCVSYAKKWRFKFGAKKTQFSTLGKPVLREVPDLFLGENVVRHRVDIELLGVSVSSHCNYSAHISNRISACRRGIFALAPGMSYPGLCTKAKVYLWKSVGMPLMYYSTECIPLTTGDIKTLNSAQGKIIKNVLGLSKRNHHSALFEALKIDDAFKHVTKLSCAFYRRVFGVNTPLLRLQSLALADYMVHRKPVPNTLIHKLCQFNISPVKAAFSKIVSDIHYTENGIIDSLRYLLFQDNFIKPWASEHVIVDLLTRAF